MPAIVQQFPCIVRVGLWHRLARHQPLGLVQRQPRTLDVRRVMRFEHQRPFTHCQNPVLGQRRGLQEPAGALDPRQRRRDGVGDRELRLQSRPVHRFAPFSGCCLSHSSMASLWNRQLAIVVISSCWSCHGSLQRHACAIRSQGCGYYPYFADIYNMKPAGGSTRRKRGGFPPKSACAG